VVKSNSAPPGWTYYTTGTVDVADDHVRLEVQLPWLLSMLANKAKALVEKQGRLMLEKPVKASNSRS
jgi:hypothetical protein